MIRKITAATLLIFSVFAFSCVANNNSQPILAPFTTDGCSLFPNGPIGKPDLWLHCCQAHDLDYWQGGTKTQRLLSDLRLQSCVTDTGHKKIAVMMFNGVQLGGSPFIPTPFRWGYGWPFPHGYKQLSSTQQSQVKTLYPIQFREK
ncbi:MAG: hypothetical protein ACPG8A_07500 [Psychrobium sp.]